MEQWLPRGFAITQEKRIKRVIVTDEEWQIYLTNQDSYVLVVTDSIFIKWVNNFSLPVGIFVDTSVNSGYKIFCSSSKYLISSLEKGPFPENNGQIEAFSVAFNTTLKLFPNINLQNAIYIEEYSFILPGTQKMHGIQNEYAYGRWITGGVNVSGNSLQRITQLMSWLPYDVLRKSVQLAGFSVDESTEDNVVTSKVPSANTQNDVTDIDTDSMNMLPNGKFTLVGRPELEQFFNDNIIDIILNQEQYKRMGITFPGATILHSPPGCGKTYAVEKLSEYLGWKRFNIDSSSTASPYIHDTSKKISEVFNSAIEAAPSIIIIDEMEAFLSDRSRSGMSGTHHFEEVAEFLRKIPEAVSNGVLVFAMTNMLESIDPAVLRRGRFDNIIEVKMANKDEISLLLATKFRSLPVYEDVDINSIASRLDGHPLSDVTFVLREAGRIAVKAGNEYISQTCFEKALNMIPDKKEERRIGFNQ